MKNLLIKEKFIFVIFLFFNVGLAIHCVTSAVRETANNIKTTVKREKDSVKTGNFHTISEIQKSYSKNTLTIKFTIPSNLLCIKRYSLDGYYSANSLKECSDPSQNVKEILFFKGNFLLDKYASNIDLMLHSDYPEFLFFEISENKKSHFAIYKMDEYGSYSWQDLDKSQTAEYSLLFQKESPKTKIYKSPTLLLVYHSSNNLKYPLIIGVMEEQSSEKKQLIARLDWDMNYVTDEKEFQKLFWLLATPVAFVIDIVTLPLQALMYGIGIIVYLAIK